MKQRFLDIFKREPLMVRSPGRVNLIGEHTDYNNGFVLPAAIDRDIVFAICKNGTGTCQLHSADMGESFNFRLDRLEKNHRQWANYVMGVVQQFQYLGVDIGGFDCVLGGNVPIGAGMSSSAALECSLAFALDHVFGAGLSRLELAQLAQRAENSFVGVKCGIMDQFASLFGKEGHVICLDCRSLEHSYFPFPSEAYHIVLCNSMVSHSLAGSEYNLRRQQCQEGLAVLQRQYPETASLRDASPAMVDSQREALGDLHYRRCRHVTEENARVEAAGSALAEGNMLALGALMYHSHESLSKLYEVSCPELDILVELATGHPGVIGARMMGGGFGGCTINLVAVGQEVAFQEFIAQQYQAKTGNTPELYVCEIADGTGFLQ